MKLINVMITERHIREDWCEVGVEVPDDATFEDAREVAEAWIATNPDELTNGANWNEGEIEPYADDEEQYETRSSNGNLSACSLVLKHVGVHAIHPDAYQEG